MFNADARLLQEVIERPYPSALLKFERCICRFGSALAERKDDPIFGTRKRNKESAGFLGWLFVKIPEGRVLKTDKNDGVVLQTFTLVIARQYSGSLTPTNSSQDPATHGPNGEIAGVQIGRLWRFRASALNSWLDRTRQSCRIFFTNGSHTTLLTQGGEDVKVVQELLRHANSRITLDLYAQAGMVKKRLAQSKLVGKVLKKGTAGA